MATKIYISGGAINIDDGVNDLVVINPRQFDWKIISTTYSVRDKIDNQSYTLGVLADIQNGDGIGFATAALLKSYLNKLITIANKPYKLQVQSGLIPGVSILEAFGERDGMGTSVNGEDIWSGNELTPAASALIPIPPDAGDLMSIVCEDVNDTIAGTGIQKIEIHYIDPDGIEQTTIVDTNGGTVATGILMRFVQYMHTTQVGSNGVSEGSIKIMKTGGSTATDVYNMILEGGNMSLTTNRMIPAGKTLYLQEWDNSEGNNDRVFMKIRSTDSGGVIFPRIFIFKDANIVRGSSSGQMAVAAICPEFSIVKVSGWPTSSGAEATAGWWGYLEVN